MGARWRWHATVRCSMDRFPLSDLPMKSFNICQLLAEAKMQHSTYHPSHMVTVKQCMNTSTYSLLKVRMWVTWFLIPSCEFDRH